MLCCVHVYRTVLCCVHVWRIASCCARMRVCACVCVHVRVTRVTRSVVIVEWYWLVRARERDTSAACWLLLCACVRVSVRNYTVCAVQGATRAIINTRYSYPSIVHHTAPHLLGKPPHNYQNNIRTPHHTTPRRTIPLCVCVLQGGLQALWLLSNPTLP